MNSITGNLLTGSIERPDITTYFILDQNSGRTGQSMSTSLNKWNAFGYMPIVSTFIGLGRTLLGLVHCVAHLAMAIFDAPNRASHLKEATLGAMNMARGLVEIIPILGNIATYIYDTIRIQNYERMVQETVQHNPSVYNHRITIFVFGQDFANMPLTEYHEIANRTHRQLTVDEMQNIICNRV